MRLVDTHCHLDFRDFEADLSEVLSRAWAAGVERILVPGIDLQTSQAAIELAEAHPQIFAAVGVYPNDAMLWNESTPEILEALANHPKVVAIGEIGLDYYRQRASRELQKQVLRKQLKLAEMLKLPVVIHTRNASPGDRTCIAETLEILEKTSLNGVLHSFSGNLSEAERTLALGFFIGITGPVTFKNAADLRDVVSAVPLDRLLIETDSPFLTPQPHRGQRNEPANVRFVVEKISELHNQPVGIVTETLLANAQSLFQWSI